VTIAPALVLIASLALLGTAEPADGGSAEALRIAHESRPGWRLGEVRVRRHHDRPRAEAEVISEGRVVARLRMPASGDPGAVKAEAERILSRIEIGRWAWPTEHGRAWRVPLQDGGRVVGTIKVDTRRGRLLPQDEDEDDD
jgi:hypothetical protein